MDTVDQFAAEAVLFEQWALHGTSTGEAAVREALVRLMRLYLAALVTGAIRALHCWLAASWNS